MLQRLNSLDEELYAGDGLWSREQFETMDAAFVARVESAFQASLESRAAASATVRVGARGNGSRLLKEDAAIGEVWKWFVDAKFEATAVEVLARVRAVCPGVAAEQVRVEFKKRFKEGGDLPRPVRPNFLLLLGTNRAGSLSFRSPMHSVALSHF